MSLQHCLTRIIRKPIALSAVCREPRSSGQVQLAGQRNTYRDIVGNNDVHGAAVRELLGRFKGRLLIGLPVLSPGACSRHSDGLQLWQSSNGHMTQLSVKPQGIRSEEIHHDSGAIRDTFSDARVDLEERRSITCICRLA